ncbi:MAG: TRAP transporter small permease [Lautropia sp.]
MPPDSPTSADAPTASASARRRGIAPGLEAASGRWLAALARALAIVGGVALLAVVAMSVASIVGRAGIDWGLSPVEGDYELVQFGCVIALAAFMPWCQVNRGHVTVDILFMRASDRVRVATQFAGDLVLSVLALIIVWRLWLGTLDKVKVQETTFILQMPVWWGYAAALAGMAVFALACLHSVWRDANDFIGRRPSGLDF